MPKFCGTCGGFHDGSCLNNIAEKRNEADRREEYEKNQKRIRDSRQNGSSSSSSDNKGSAIGIGIGLAFAVGAALISGSGDKIDQQGIATVQSEAPTITQVAPVAFPVELVSSANSVILDIIEPPKLAI